MPIREKGEKAKDRNGKELTGVWKKANGDGFIAEVSFKESSTGKRARIMNRFNRKDSAVDWRIHQVEEGLKGELDRQKKKGRNVKFHELVTEYLEWSRSNKKASSHTRDQYSVNHLKRYFGNRVIGVITRRDAERYIAKRRDTEIGPEDRKRKISPATINRELCCLKNMFRKAVDWGYLAINPVWGIKQTKETPPEFEFLTYEEADRLVEVCAPHIKTFLVLALHTGMRKSEMLNLKWVDVNFQTGFITVKETKNHENRHIPMNEIVVEALGRHHRRMINGKLCGLVLSNEKGEPYTNLRKSFGTALTDAGVTSKHIRIHDLRHTFASHMVMGGVDIGTVAKLLGHNDVKVTMRYTHLAPDHLQAAVGVLDRRHQNDLRTSIVDAS